MSKIIFNRVWAMPNKHTFLIKPIADLIKRYAGDGKGWIDVFAGFHSPAEVRNDLNPEANAQYHLEAEYFCKNVLFGDWKGILFDPPYSLRQLVEVYKKHGKSVTMQTTQASWWTKLKNQMAYIVKPNGIVISCGWNTNGIGKKLGFQIIEILLVAHGGAHNDTIVTVEIKIQSRIF